MRARIDVSEIEAKTKIRAKYLRALENEEWDLLPGPTFVRTFLRTYAQALDLDAKTLVDEYRLRYETPAEVEHQPVVSTTPRSRSRPTRGSSGPSRAYLTAMGAVSLVIVLLLVGLLSGKKGSAPTKTAVTGPKTTKTHGHGAVNTPATVGQADTGTRVALSLEPSAPVYVCLIDAAGRKRIPGVIIQPPYTPLTYHSTRFEITLGNSNVTMRINGKAMTVPASSRPIGYTITSSGRHTLEPSLQPTCE